MLMIITTNVVIIDLKRCMLLDRYYTFDDLFILLVRLARLLGQLLISQNAEVSDGAASLALSNHLLQHLCKDITSWMVSRLCYEDLLLTISAAILYLVTTRSSAMVGSSSLMLSSPVMILSSVIL